MDAEPNRVAFKIVVKKVERPFSQDPLEEFEWLCQTLGFYEPIDKDKTASSIFKAMLVASDRGEALTSSAIAQRVGMSRGSVINHLNNLMRSGIVVHAGRYYMLRSRSVLRTIEEIQEDVERVFERMKRTAREIDEELGTLPSEKSRE
ncbi:MAG: helix-turn-helix domain-containing protein [archaeon]|nr:helix-turn-helix domain-containing protein [archaeon]